jgi:hypothetical protein
MNVIEIDNLTKYYSTIPPIAPAVAEAAAIRTSGFFLIGDRFEQSQTTGRLSFLMLIGGYGQLAVSACSNFY